MRSHKHLLLVETVFECFILMCKTQKRKDKFMDILLKLPDCKLVLVDYAHSVFSDSQCFDLYNKYISVHTFFVLLSVYLDFMFDFRLFSCLFTLTGVFWYFVFRSLFRRGTKEGVLSPAGSSDGVCGILNLRNPKSMLNIRLKVTNSVLFTEKKFSA